MNVLQDDLFKNKYFLSILVVLGVIILFFWVKDFNSVESQCSRHVKKLGSMLNYGGTKSREMALEKASESLIQDCIERGGP